MSDHADLDRAAAAARYFATYVQTIRALPDDAAETRRAFLAELAHRYEADRSAIASVTDELRLTRHQDGAIHSGDISASTAHEVAVSMVLALNREVFRFEVLGL